MALSDLQLGYDTTFELNEFGQPRIRSEVELVKDVVLFILFSKPGQYPSLPMIGLDVQDMLYSYYDEIDADQLRSKIVGQCEALGAYFTNTIIGIRKMIYRKQPALLIHIEGKEEYPSGYMKDTIGIADKYLIGITFDELNQMIYNISTREGG